MSDQPNPPGAAKPQSAGAAIPYVAPFAVFLALTQLESLEALAPFYPVIYSVKAAAVAAALWYCREALLRFPFAVSPLALLLGAAGVVMWVGLEQVPYPKPEFLGGGRAAFNPEERIADPALRVAFLAVRFLGLAVLVPLMEELFWRGFLIRYVQAEDFESVPVGKVTPAAFAIVAIAFAAVHPEWLPALLYAAAANWLLMRTQSLWACIQMHAVTNLLLGIYVMVWKDWRFW